jgi:hypothetical protein
MEALSVRFYFQQKVKYSDNDKQYIPVESSSIKRLGENKHVLETNINLPNLAVTGNSFFCCINFQVGFMLNY